MESTNNLDYIKDLTPKECELLDKLVPFSNKSTRVKQIENLQFFKSQIEYITQNETMLNINEELELQRSKIASDNGLKNSMGWVMLSGWSSFTYYVVKVAPGKNLYPEMGKSLGVGIFASALYQYYHMRKYRNTVRHYFDEIISRKMDVSKKNFDKLQNEEKIKYYLLKK